MIFKTTKAFSLCCHKEAEASYELYALGYMYTWHWVCSSCCKRCNVYHKKVWVIPLPKRAGRRMWLIPLWWKKAEWNPYIGVKQ